MRRPRITRFRVSPYPNKIAIRLKYADYQFVAPLTSVAHWKVSANNLWDPYVPTGGHQPRGYDQLFAIYQRAAVKWSKIKVVVPDAVDQPCMLGIRRVGPDDTTTPTKPNDIAEANYKFIQIPQSSSAQHPNKWISQVWSWRQSEGSHYLDDTNQQDSTGGPENQWDFQIAAGNMTESTSVSAFQVNYFVIYYVVFYNRYGIWGQS